jgi:hypothetical protein
MGPALLYHLVVIFGASEIPRGTWLWQAVPCLICNSCPHAFFCHLRIAHRITTELSSSHYASLCVSSKLKTSHAWLPWNVAQRRTCSNTSGWAGAREGAEISTISLCKSPASPQFGRRRESPTWECRTSDGGVLGHPHLFHPILQLHSWDKLNQMQCLEPHLLSEVPACLGVGCASSANPKQNSETSTFTSPHLLKLFLPILCGDSTVFNWTNTYWAGAIFWCCSRQLTYVNDLNRWKHCPQGPYILMVTQVWMLVSQKL